VLKITAQMPPIGLNEQQNLRLQIQEKDSDDWQTISEENIHELARTATFRIENWDVSRDIPYRLVYGMTDPEDKIHDYYWEGTIRREPIDKDKIIVAAFTGNTDAGFPNSEIVKNVFTHDPDVLVFTGDQLYESVGGYGFKRESVEVASLDYLRKWYIFGWAFRDLMRDRPSISIPDDHDVYQGNIWGGGGRKIEIEEHDRGGYVMPAEWVNMVQRTQTSHLPDPFDPTPVEQGIGVYYTDMNYGRISFAILEDRKFKTGPKGTVPETTSGRSDHVIDEDFDPKTADIPGAKLLGDRQLKFLKNWASDWSDTDFKVALSQTIFANVANYHGADKMYLVADYDSNGWPQTGRNKALHELRRGFAFMIGGDQHLASIVHHGIEDWNDAGFSFCVPSIAAGYPRSWHPKKSGKNQQEGAPNYTGGYLDGFGNHVTVHAVANPKDEIRKETLHQLHDKASGYGIVRLNKKSQEITMECWPLLADQTNFSNSGQFQGWPMTINMHDNYGRKPMAYLPTIKVTGMENPVVQVIDESDSELVYTLRIRGTSFRPGVFKLPKSSSYTIKIGEPGSNKMQIFTNIASISEDENTELPVKF
jgi:phosphodiesterase/alkaline phosphatase D-like protein